jgi:hypothetical protein
LKRRAEITAKLLLALFALWQTSTLLHLALVPHALCPDGGEVVHVDHDGEPTHDHENEHSRHDGCRHLVLLTHSNTIQADGPPEVAADDSDEIVFQPSVVSPQTPSREIYRLAPSHSPPTAA